MLVATFPPASNRADWIETVAFVDPETDDLIDLSGATIAVTLNEMDGCPRLTAAAQIITTGVAQFIFTRDQMMTLCAGPYSVGATLERDGATVQVVIATVPVMNGLVPK